MVKNLKKKSMFALTILGLITALTPQDTLAITIKKSIQINPLVNPVLGEASTTFRCPPGTVASPNGPRDCIDKEDAPKPQ